MFCFLKDKNLKRWFFTCLVIWFFFSKLEVNKTKPTFLTSILKVGSIRKILTKKNSSQICSLACFPISYFKKWLDLIVPQYNLRGPAYFRYVSSSLDLAMAGATNDCLCCDSLKISSILAKLELFLWIILFVVNFVIQKDLKDPIWLAGSISIFIFLLINTGMQIYALSSKNFCLILSCGLVTLFVIVFANSALIYYISLGYHIDLQQSSSILESMENNQVT